MKKIIYSLPVLFSTFFYSQNVGIGIKSPETILHIDAKKNTTSTDAASYYDDAGIIASGKMGVGNVSPTTRVDLRSSENKNAIGIGGTTQTAIVAKAGALRYNTSTKDMSYSDGTNWIQLPYKAPSDFVQAENSSGQSFANNTTNVVTGWTENEDVNSRFDPATGIFTASKNGIYVVSFNFTFASGTIADDTKIEAIVQTSSTSTTTNPIFKCVNSYPGNTAGTATNLVSGSCSGIFNLVTGDTIRPSVFQNLGTSKSLSTDKTLTSFSVFGL